MLQFRRFVQKRSAYDALFPPKLLNKKHKTPDNLYVAKDEVAQLIDNAIVPYMERSSCTTAIEMNPGIGLITRKLLNREDRIQKILLFEPMEHFMPRLQELHSLYPDRVKVKQGDIIGISKLVYQDKMDNGTRVADLLQDVPKQAYSDEPSALLFGAVGSYTFFKHLINSIVFHHGLFNCGRLEMFLVLPPPIYIHLTCSNKVGYLMYRATSMLFQMMFEHRFISQLPRVHFLPVQSEFNFNNRTKLKELKSSNIDYLFLVRIVPRQDFFNLCSEADLTALWYFVKQNCISRRNRIIPTLEKYIPGCGARLIINAKATESVQYLYEDEIEEQLPQYSGRSTTMSNRDFFPNMNIWTQFGDLTPSQMLSLFNQFRHMPEYSDCSFLASLENSLLRMEASSDESIDDGIGITEEDDLGSEEIVIPAESEAAVKVEKTSRKRKQKAFKTN